MHWLAIQDSSEVFTTAITQAEILYGVEALPPGRRKTRLLAAIDKIFAEEFGQRILPFDHDAARTYAGIVVGRGAVGRPISQFDAMIAAISRCHGAALATCNIGDFEGCGITVINPWTG